MNCPKCKRDMIRRIVTFQNLETGWNGYPDSQPIRKETIRLALQIVMFLPPGHEWFVVPTSEGGIMFESDSAIIEVIDVGRRKDGDKNKSN